MAGLEHQHPLTGRKRIYYGCFPSAGTGPWINNDRPGCLENRANIFQNFHPQFRELRASVVNHGTIYGP